MIPRFKAGYVPDLPDKRDHYFKVSMPIIQKLPDFLDLRNEFMPPPYNQGDFGSCTANAYGAAIQYNKRFTGKPDFTPSRFFLYYNTRKIMGTIEFDSGGSIRDTVKASNKWGVPPETMWDYIPEHFSQEPPTEVYTAAEKHQTVKYSRIDQDLKQIQGRIFMNFPVVFGFVVYDSFLTEKVAKTGIMPMPDLEKERSNGGHAIMGCGWDNKTGMILTRNSWGPEFGGPEEGYFWMPYEFLLDPDFCADFWTMEIQE